MPKAYRQWRDAAALIVRTAWRGMEPLRFARVRILIRSTQRPHCDADNQIKSVLDALVYGGALADDRYVDDVSVFRDKYPQDECIVTISRACDSWAR